MTGLDHAKSFRDSLVYKKARVVAGEICEVTKGFSKEEMFSLADHVRRCSRSIGAQIAEAWAKRRYVKHFVSKLTDADGEQLETQHWVDTAEDCGYLPSAGATVLHKQLGEIGRMLNSMIDKASQFCSKGD